MAKTKEIVRHKAPTVSKKKFELAVSRAKSSGARARRVADERIGLLVGCGAAFAAGKYEKSGKKLPSIFGVEGTAVVGAGLAFIPSLVGAGRGRLGSIAAEAGASLLGIACYKAGKGIAPIIGGDDGEGWSAD